MRDDWYYGLMEAAFRRVYRLGQVQRSNDVVARNSIGRRELLRTLAGSAVAALVPGDMVRGLTAAARIGNGSAKTLRIWVFSDAHVGRDKQHGVESLATPLRQSESASGFDWDIALDLGDMSGDLGLPKDAEGAEVVRQFGALKSTGASKSTICRETTTAAASTSRRHGGGASGSTPPVNTASFPASIRLDAHIPWMVPGSAIHSA